MHAGRTWGAVALLSALGLADWWIGSWGRCCSFSIPLPLALAQADLRQRRPATPFTNLSLGEGGMEATRKCYPARTVSENHLGNQAAPTANPGLRRPRARGE